MLCVWLLFLCPLARTADQDSGGSLAFTSDGLQNVTGIIENLLKGYDIRLRPSFGGDPLHIDMEIVIASFDSISEVNMDYTITLYLNQYWKDERLKYSDSSQDHMTLTGDFAEKIWVPDTFFANDKNSFLHDVTEKNKMVKLFGDGSIAYGMRFTTTLACMMDLHYYPLDQQNCTVEVESYGYPMEDVIMKWKGDKPIQGVDKIELPQFTLKGYEANSAIERLSTGDYQRLSLSFRLDRNIGYFIFQTYLPSILIVMLSWVSFWINHEATSARVALGITTVLTMTTISTGVRSSLPRISYVKAIDIYLVMCFVFVFAALLEYAAVNYTYWGARAKKKVKKSREQHQKQNDAETEYVSDHTEAKETVMDTKTPDTIELHDVRMSPILSLRNKQNYNFDETTNSVRVTSPSFRMAQTVPRATYAIRTHTQMIRRRHQQPAPRKRRVMSQIRRKAVEIRSKIPQIRDVNKIDKYSRLTFPSLFILFNLCYWSFYLIQ